MVISAARLAAGLCCTVGMFVFWALSAVGLQQNRVCCRPQGHHLPYEEIKGLNEESLFGSVLLG